MATLFNRRTTRVLAGSLAALLLCAFGAFAQNPPLGEVARQEQQRRKTTKPATKVVTNKDLPKVTSPAPNAPPPAPDLQKEDAAAAEPAQADKAEDKPKNQGHRSTKRGPANAASFSDAGASTNSAS